jgi:hypothetical protein
MSARTWLLPMLALGPLACGSDQLRQLPCVDEQQAFNIEEVSQLELVHAVEGGADGVLLTADTSKLDPDAAWRVGPVQLLVAIPKADFATYPKDVTLAVQVWDGFDPTRSQPWTIQQTLDTSKLEWTESRTSKDTLDDFGLPTQTSVVVKTAWWTFDFSKVIPDSGMTSPKYLVAVKWTSGNLPIVGASQFNRPCNLNWTDYGPYAYLAGQQSGWVLNPATESTCSWPMFKVATQSITLKATCD